MLCNELLPEDGLFAECCDCEYGYHLGSCSGVSEGTFKSRGETAKKSWRCKTCRTSKSRGDKNERESESDLCRVLAEMNAKLGDLASIREKVDTLMTMKATVDSIEHQVQKMSDKYDNLLSAFKEQSEEIKELRERVTDIETQDQGNTKEVKALKQEINRLEQYSRRQNMEIHGLPKTEGENLLCKINDLAEKLSLDELTKNDLNNLHRLPPKPGKNPVILIRFVSQATRDKWLAKKNGLKETGLNVTFFDNLTAHNRQLLWMTKTRAQEKGYRFTWQKNGNIYVRKAEGNNVINIGSEDDLAKII
ncbi:unnamed protein product [Ixodes persulcatus]